MLFAGNQYNGQDIQLGGLHKIHIMLYSKLLVNNIAPGSVHRQGISSSKVFMYTKIIRQKWYRIILDLLMVGIQLYTTPIYIMTQ